MVVPDSLKGTVSKDLTLISGTKGFGTPLRNTVPAASVAGSQDVCMRLLF